MSHYLIIERFIRRSTPLSNFSFTLQWLRCRPVERKDAWHAKFSPFQAVLLSSLSVGPAPGARSPCRPCALWIHPCNCRALESEEDLGWATWECARGNCSGHSAPNTTHYCRRQRLCARYVVRMALQDFLHQGLSSWVRCPNFVSSGRCWAWRTPWRGTAAKSLSGAGRLLLLSFAIFRS